MLLREKPSTKQIISIGLAVLGISVINFHGFSADKEGSFWGNILIIGAVISEAFFTIYAKKLSGILSPLQMAVGVNIIGLILFFPFAFNEAMNFVFNKIGSSMWLLLVYYAMTASVFSFILWYRGIKHVDASIAGIFTGFMPVAATLVGFIFLKESFGFNHLIGMISIFVAIYLGTTSSSQNKIKH